MQSYVHMDDILTLLNGEMKDPFNILGLHKVDLASNKHCFCIRAYYPNAENILAIESDTGNVHPMIKVHEGGFFEVLVSEREDFFMYKLEVTDTTGNTFITYDSYSFWPVITDYDLHLYNEGNHHRIYEKLGAHLMSINEVPGVFFAVWAPCAKRVSVIGNFNQWDGRRHQMRCRGSSGVWEIFIPGITEGDIYKYEVKTATGEIYKKSDPYAFYSELRPNTASIVMNLEGYDWTDDDWISSRENCNIFEKPVSVYEVHLGSWAATPEEGDRPLTYREHAERLVDYVASMGYTHIELLPLAEHPFDGSWGYQVTGYYSVTSRFGKPEDFMYFVDCCHNKGIGVILDWVPAHFPKDGHGLARFDGTALYEHASMLQGEHPDWGTHVFNYGRHEVRNFLISNAVFWFEKYHIDGLRVDAVASMLYLDYGKKAGEWVPNKWGSRENIDAVEFLKQLNSTVYQYYPGIMMIAEESTSWPLVTKPPYMGGLGFTFKWNMGWMNDFLRYVSMDPIFRKYHQNLITFSLMYAYTENFVLVLSHDEVVHGKCSMIGKMPGDYWQKFAGLRASYGFMYGHPGKKLLFMGNDYGQFIEWDFKRSLDWHLLDYDMHKKMNSYIRDLNNLYKNEKALYETDYDYTGFEWMDCSDSDHSVVSFIRRSKDWKDCLIFVCNFTPVYHGYYRIGVPFCLYYAEIFNSDSELYGGSNAGNFGGVAAEEIPCHNKPFSIGLQIPPLSTLILRPIFKEEGSNSTGKINSTGKDSDLNDSIVDII